MGDISEMYREWEYEDAWRERAEDEIIESKRREWLDEQIQFEEMQRRAKQKIWTQADGTPIAIKDMSNRHLLNAYRLLLRKGFIGLRTFACYMSEGPSGEMAQIAFEAEQQEAWNRPVSPFVDLFEDEIKARKLELPSVPDYDDRDEF